MKQNATHIQAVIFDMGRVLVNMDSAPLKEKLYKNLEENEIKEPERQFLHNPMMVSFNQGQITPDEFHRQVCKKYRLEMDLETFEKLWRDIFWTMDGMEELVGRVSSRIKVGLLSDTDPVHWNYIRQRWPWIDAIKKPTLSFEVGAMKPSAEIYLAAANNVNTPPERCLFIDDLKANVEGALAVGMQGIRFESAARLEEQLRGILDLGA